MKIVIREVVLKNYLAALQAKTSQEDYDKLSAIEEFFFITTQFYTNLRKSFSVAIENRGDFWAQ